MASLQKSVAISEKHLSGYGNYLLDIYMFYLTEFLQMICANPNWSS